MKKYKVTFGDDEFMVIGANRKPTIHEAEAICQYELMVREPLHVTGITELTEYDLNELRKSEKKLPTKDSIKFYEVEVDNDPTAEKGEYSTCILGRRQPSIEEAEKFLQKDMETLGYKHVVAVNEIYKEEAYASYLMTEDSDKPIFQ